MSDYLLPCSCGRKLPVSVRHAGHTLRCACGAQLEVPTLRGLRELEQVETRPATGRAWGDRQRVAFVLTTVTLAAIAVTGGLAIRLPARPVLPQLPEVNQDTPILDVFAVLDDLRRGIDAEPPELNSQQRAIVERRERMLWGIAIAAGIGLCAAVGAVVVVVSGRPRKR